MVVCWFAGWFVDLVLNTHGFGLVWFVLWWVLWLVFVLWFAFGFVWWLLLLRSSVLIVLYMLVGMCFGGLLGFDCLCLFTCLLRACIER